jgi:hypothetical protein
MKRRSFLGCGTAVGAAALAARGAAAEPVAVPPFELDEATVEDLQKRMAGGETTPGASPRPISPGSPPSIDRAPSCGA